MAKLIGDVSPNALRELELLIKKEDYEKKKRKVTLEFQKKAKIKGFRPGKAPLELINQYFGPDIEEEAIRQIVREELHKELEARNLKVVGKVEVKDVKKEKNGDIKILVEVEVMPNFVFPSLASIKVEKRIKRVTQADIDGEIERYRDELAEFVPKKGEIEYGDYVNVEYLEKNEQGKVVFKRKNAYIWIDESKFHRDAIEKLLGKKVGDEVTIDVTFKDESGKEIKRQLIYRIKGIKRKVLPEVNDEFAKVLEFESLEDMKEKIRKELEEKYQKDAEREFEKKLIEEIYERVNFELPPSMVERAQKFWEQLLGKEFKEKVDNAEEIVKSLAEHEVKKEIILERFVEQFDVKVEDSEIEEEIKKRAREYGMPVEAYRRKLEESGEIETLVDSLKRKKALEQMKSMVKMEVLID